MRGRGGRFGRNVSGDRDALWSHGQVWSARPGLAICPRALATPFGWDPFSDETICYTPGEVTESNDAARDAAGTELND